MNEALVEDETRVNKKRKKLGSVREQVRLGKQKADLDREEFEDEDEKQTVLAWREDPGLLWLTGQSGYAYYIDVCLLRWLGERNWVEFIPQLEEMPPDWPGNIPLEGLSAIHLTPDCESSQKLTVLDLTIFYRLEIRRLQW